MHQSQIIQHLFQVPSLEDVSRERLETFVGEYPSFGIGHYLLSRKLQKEDAVGFEEKTQLTCLYFSNPFWLQWLLENTDAGGQKAVPEEKAFATLPREEAPAATFVNEPTPAQVEAPLPEEVAAQGEPPTPWEPPALEGANAREEWAPQQEATEPIHEDLPSVENVVTMAEKAFHEGPAAAPAMEGTEAAREASSSAAEQLLQSIEQARELRESLQKINTHFTDEGEIPGEELAAAAEPVSPEAEPAAEPVVAVAEPVWPEADPVVAGEPARPVFEETPIRDEEVPFVLEEIEEPRASVEESPAAEAEAPQPAAVVEEHVQAVVESAAVAAEPVTVQEAGAAPAIVFEPLHTIDYFASQGIKFTLEENPVDALGKQLKSFTDWLKTMRRLPQKNKEVVPDRLAEQAVQDFAAHSIEGKEVLTEAMAEVLAKQGMRQRARAVYEKLSLLNPEKSAYFAAKIEQLNIL
jgi:hypothetical protein